MLGILRKDYLLFALATLVVFPALLLTERFISAELRVATVVTNLVLTWMLALGSLMVTELEEEHSHSYELLTSLPLRLREIVAAKFLLFLTAVAALTAQQFAFLKVVQVAPALVAIAQPAVLVGGAACLVFGGIAQAAIFSLGYARFTVFSLVALTALSFVPPLLLAMGGTNAREAVRQTAGFLLTLNPGVVVLAGLALYALLFLVSVALFYGPKSRR